jgi:lactoylglutathione lyase
MNGIRLNLVVIYVSDVAKTRAFYERIGLTFQAERHGRGPEHYSTNVGETVLEIYPAKALAESAAAPAVRLGFDVKDVRGIVAQLVEPPSTQGCVDNGIVADAASIDTRAAAHTIVVTEPAENADGWRALVRDPDGRKVELFEPRAPRYCCG